MSKNNQNEDELMEMDFSFIVDQLLGHELTESQQKTKEEFIRVREEAKRLRKGKDPTG